MTIKQQGGIFGRNPSYNEVDANELNVDNIKIDGNAITSTDTNGDIGLNPNGTGSLLIGNNGQSSYVAAKIRKKFNGSVSVQFDGGGDTAYADFTMDGSENLALRLDPSNTLNDQTFSVSHNGSNIAQFIGSSGDLKVNTGNLIIGTSGQGIDFSATSDASGSQSELLSDYEHGTWTVTDLSAAGLTFTNPTGQYVRVGRFVSAFAAFTFPTTSDTNNASIGGLPYNALNDNSSRATGVITYSNYASTHSLWIYGPRNSGQFLIIDSGANAKTNANLSGKTFYVQFNYQT